MMGEWDCVLQYFLGCGKELGQVTFVSPKYLKETREGRLSLFQGFSELGRQDGQLIHSGSTWRRVAVHTVVSQGAACWKQGLGNLQRATSSDPLSPALPQLLKVSQPPQSNS